MRFIHYLFFCILISIIAFQSFSDATEIIESSLIPAIQSSTSQSQPHDMGSFFSENSTPPEPTVPPELEVVYAATQAKQDICYSCDDGKQIIFNTYWRETPFGSKMNSRDYSHAWDSKSYFAEVWDHFNKVTEILSGNPYLNILYIDVC